MVVPAKISCVIVLAKISMVPRKEEGYLLPIKKSLFICPYKGRPIVLNPEAKFLYSLIDNQHSVEEILNLAQKEDPEFELKDLMKVIKGFRKNKIIYFNKSEPLKDKKPKTLGVWLHLTNQCNLRCTYCFVHKSRASMNLKTAHLTLKKVFSLAGKHGYQNITLKFSGGEALLELKKMEKMVGMAQRYAKINKLKCRLVLLTNGILINQKVAEFLKKHHFTVAVSLDGLKEDHDKTRIFPNGKGSFNDTYRGIEILRQAGVRFNVTVTISRQNIKNLPEIAHFLLKQKIPFIFNFVRENEGYTVEAKNENKELIKYLRRAYRVIGDNLPVTSIIDNLLDRVNFKQPHLHPCGVGRNYLVVRHDGKIASCQMTLDKPIGSIEDKDPIKTMREKSFTKGITVDQKRRCHSCRWRYFCAGGCPLLKNAPYCAVYKALIPEVLKLEAKRLIGFGSVI